MDNLVPGSRPDRKSALASLRAVHRQGQRYDNEDDRIRGFRAAQLRYASQLWQCDICNTVLLRGNKSAHLKSNKHNNHLNKNDN
jgi:hypothetical protein